MRKLMFAVVIFVLLSSVVSAATLYGEYEGNPIVKVVNGNTGQEITSPDVPAISFNGRTMVPIRMLQNVGTSISWDQEKQTVFVYPDSPKTTVSDNSEIHINQLKAYSRIAEQYKRIGALGDIISSLSQRFSTTYETIESNRVTESELNDSLKFLNNAVDAYNYTLKPTQEVIDFASGYGLNVSDMNTILGDYFIAIEYYKKSYEGLELFSINQTNQNFDAYLNNSTDGFDSITDARTSALNGYFKYYNMIQDY